MSTELFTPEGYAPALAELGLHQLTVGEQLQAIAEMLAPIAIDSIVDQLSDRFKYKRDSELGWWFTKPTHTAVLLGQENPDDYYSAKVWLHDYTNGIAPCEQRKFTMHPHNHRDGMVSRILQKGYVASEQRFSGESPNEVITDRNADWEALRSVLKPVGGHYFEGDLMSIHPDEVHQLDRVLAGTLSLVVRLPAQRNFSVVFDHGPQIKPDMMSQMDVLIEDLQKMTNMSPSGTNSTALYERKKEQ